MGCALPDHAALNGRSQECLERAGVAQPVALVEQTEEIERNFRSGKLEYSVPLGVALDPGNALVSVSSDEMGFNDS